MKFTFIPFSLLIIFCSAEIKAQDRTPEIWEGTIQNFENQDKANPPKKGSVLFTGSSSIAMWQDVQNYFPEHIIINRGFGGSEFSDLLHYADRVIYNYEPSKIFIYEGDNDLAAGETVESILKEAKKLREEIKSRLPGTTVIFISPKPSLSRWELKEKYEDLNKGLREYSQTTPQTQFADVWTAMLNDNGEVLEHVFLEDGLHMNSEGYQIWQSVLRPYLGKR